MKPIVSALVAPATRRRWAALAAGIALVGAFEPVGWYWLSVFALAALVMLWDGQSPRQAAWIGFAFGFGLFAAGTWWLYISLNILGGLLPPLAVLLMLGLVVLMASYVALTGYLSVRLVPGGGALRWLFVFPAAWTVFEWLRGWLFTGFPWMSLGYSQADSLLGALAPVAGVYGVTLATVVLAGALATAVGAPRQQRPLALVALVIVLGGAMAAESMLWTNPTGKRFDVRLVQGAVPQDQKWLPQQLQPTLTLYRELSQSDAPLDVIVWPEAAVPALPYEVQDYLDEVTAEMRERQTQLFTGILTYDTDAGEFRNTLLALGPESGRYHKRHLVPFGEYFPVPDFVLHLMRLMSLPSENVSPGGEDQLPLRAAGVAIAPTICYEIAYGAEQRVFFPESQLLLNVSNDAWFGDTIAPHQHLQINQFRARESGRWMLRATNTGITAVIDHSGKVMARLPQFEPGALDATVQLRAGETPYMRTGNALVLCIAAVMALFGAWLALPPGR